MLDQKSLECFAAVARLGSFRAAANRLNTTQPAVSARIMALEAELGVPILSRTTRTVALTPQGRVLLGYVDQLIALRHELIEMVVGPGERGGTLRLGVAETVVHSWLPDFLERASAAFPTLAFEIEVDNSVNLRDRLVEHNLDLAFLLGPNTVPGLSAEPIMAAELIFLARRGLLPQRRITPLEDLVRWPLITFARRTEPYVRLQGLLKAARLTSKARVHASASVATIARMAQDGLGVALLPRITVRDALQRGDLIVVPTGLELPPLTFEVAWHAVSDAPFLRRIVKLAHESAAPFTTLPGLGRSRRRPTRLTP